MAGIFGSPEDQQPVVVDFGSLANRLTAINGCHYGVLCTIEKLVELLRTVKGHVSDDVLHRAYMRIGVALTQLDKVFGPFIMNGRDLVYIPPYSHFRDSIKTLRMMQSPLLEKTIYEMDMLDKFLTILVDGWQKVPKNLVGATSKSGRYNSFLPPLEGGSSSGGKATHEHRQPSSRKILEIDTSSENLTVDAT